MKFNELSTLSEDDLVLKKKELSEEIFKQSSQLKVTRKLEQPHLLKQAKKNKARVLTALRQKKEN